MKKFSYQCNNYHFKACSQKPSVREHIIEKALIQALVDRAERLTAIAKQDIPEVDPPEIQALKAELSYYQAAPGNRAAGIVQDLKAQIEALYQHHSNQEKVQSMQQELLQTAFQDQRYWATLLPEEKRDLYRALVDRVLISEGQVTTVELKV